MQAVDHRERVKRPDKRAVADDLAGVRRPVLRGPPDAQTVDQHDQRQVQEPGDADEEHQRQRQRGQRGERCGGDRRCAAANAAGRPSEVVEPHGGERQRDDFRDVHPAEEDVQRIKRQQHPGDQRRHARAGHLEHQQAEAGDAQQAEEGERVEPGAVAEQFGEDRHPQRVQVIELPVPDVLASIT